MLGLIVLLQTLMLALSGPPTSTEYLPIRVAVAEGYFTEEGRARARLVRLAPRTGGSERRPGEGHEPRGARAHRRDRLRRSPRGARPGADGDAAARPGAGQAARRFSNTAGRRGDARRRHRERRALCTRRPPPAGPRLVRARARAQKGRAADPDRRGQGAGRQAPDQGRRWRLRGVRGPACDLPRALPSRRRGFGRPGSADDRDHPRAHAAAPVGADPASRGNASDQAPDRSLTTTPNPAKSRRVASTGSPTTFVYEPTTPSTSAPSRSWIA